MLGVNARSVLLALGLKLSRRCSSGDCALTASSTGCGSILRPAF